MGALKKSVISLLIFSLLPLQPSTAQAENLIKPELNLIPPLSATMENSIVIEFEPIEYADHKLYSISINVCTEEQRCLANFSDRFILNRKVQSETSAAKYSLITVNENKFIFSITESGTYKISVRKVYRKGNDSLYNAPSAEGVYTINFKKFGKAKINYVDQVTAEIFTNPHFTLRCPTNISNKNQEITCDVRYARNYVSGIDPGFLDIFEFEEKSNQVAICAYVDIYDSKGCFPTVKPYFYKKIWLSIGENKKISIKIKKNKDTTIALGDDGGEWEDYYFQPKPKSISNPAKTFKRKCKQIQVPNPNFDPTGPITVDGIINENRFPFRYITKCSP